MRRAPHQLVEGSGHLEPTETLLATPRGFAQCETAVQVFELVTNEAFREGLALVRLTA